MKKQKTGIKRVSSELQRSQWSRCVSAGCAYGKCPTSEQWTNGLVRQADYE